MADFVARGFITGVRDRPKLQHTEVLFRATRVFQQTSGVFTPIHSTSSKRHDHHDAFDVSEIFTQIESNLLMTEDHTTFSPIDNTHQQYTGKFQVPIHCGAQSGPGEFMIMGHVRLGQPMLKCAPRLNQWHKIVKEKQVEAPCVLLV